MSERDTPPVGYKSPPKHGRFKKGVSGNPAGRPARASDLATAVIRAIRQPMTIEENGRQRTVSTLQAIVIRLIDRAAGGDLDGLRILSSFQLKNGDPAPKRKLPTVQFIA